MLEYQNGCTLPKTMVTYSKFNDSPHVHLLQMSYEEEQEVELVSVGFMHYGNDMIVHFSSEHDAGEVWLMDGDVMSEETGYVPYGMIEVDQLVELLKVLPHIDSFMVQDAEGVH